MEPLEDKETAKLRSLIGALAWPATQCAPTLAASMSLLQAANPTVNDFLEGNQALRFAREAVDCYRLEVNYHGELSKLTVPPKKDTSSL